MHNIFGVVQTTMESNGISLPTRYPKQKDDDYYDRLLRKQMRLWQKKNQRTVFMDLYREVQISSRNGIDSASIC
jgi:hypothetical protein